MINVNKLRGRIVEAGLSVSDVALELGIDRSTFYRKLNDKDGSFTVREVTIMSKLLCLNSDDINSIFFASSVA